MLYGVFVFFMISLSIMGIIHMVATESYTYIIFPISMIVWGVFKYFKEDDDEYCRRNNINRDIDSGWLGGEYADGYYDDYGAYHRDYSRTNNISIHSRPSTCNYRYSDPEYKKIAPRVKRNSIVTTEKVKTK